MAWNNVLLSKKFILYKEGISNKSVEEFFIQNKVDYYLKTDDNELSYLDDGFIVIKSPGIPNDTIFLLQCKRLKIKVINDIELFYLLRSDINYIGITGSCGKTTTCNLLYNIMKEKYKVYVCGNIGIPIFKFINMQLDFLIVELSSYQLEYIYKFKPKYFIILNIFNHHLNHHHSFNNYLSSKLNPLKNMDSSDTLIINEVLSRYVRRRNVVFQIFTFSNSGKSDAINEDNLLIFKDKKLDVSNIEFFKYDYNKENFLSLFILLSLLEINNYKEIILDFKNLPNRMEEVINKNDLIVINDSKSTSFNALNEGIKYCLKMYKDYEIVVIMGGKIDYDEIIQNVNIIKALDDYKVYCYGENKELINKLIKCKIFISLKDVIENLDIKKKLVILFSPAAQSFDQFSSYEERGETFKKLIINKLKN